MSAKPTKPRPRRRAVSRRPRDRGCIPANNLLEDQWTSYSVFHLLVTTVWCAVAGKALWVLSWSCTSRFVAESRSFFRYLIHTFKHDSLFELLNLWSSFRRCDRVHCDFHCRAERWQGLSGPVDTWRRCRESRPLPVRFERWSSHW